MASSETSYRILDTNDDESLSGAPRHPLWNFVILSILFSINHGTMVSCLAFVTLQLGEVGAFQLCFLHIVFGASSLLGATFCVKQFGPRNSMVVGMAMYATYVACFWLSLKWKGFVDAFAVVGALVGGTGGGLLWVAQGAYFGRASRHYAIVTNKRPETATSLLAGVFACIYLSAEVVCKLVSFTMLEATHAQWTSVFCVYTMVAATATGLTMLFVHNYPPQEQRHQTVGYKMTAAWQLLRNDRKMQYMMALNAVFGFAYPFVNSYVNGEVTPQVLVQWKYVGLLSAITSAVAALCNLIFMPVPNGPVLTMGALSFGTVALLFMIRTDLTKWSWGMLVGVYSLQGLGRATMEGALRATYADFFANEPEGAFANIILQNGVFTALGFYLSYAIPCFKRGPYCVECKEGVLHNILYLEVAVVASAVLAILGYWRASCLFQIEQDTLENDAEAPYLLVNTQMGAADDSV